MDDDNYRDEAGAGDDPAAAFDRLRGEVSLLRSAIEGLTAARESIDIPDYEPTLERTRSEEHTSELQSLMRISYAVFCLKKKKIKKTLKYTMRLQEKQQQQEHSRN